MTAVPAQDALAHAAAFAGLTADQRAAVLAVAREVTLPAGAAAFVEGAPATGCWVLLSGQVSLTTQVPGRGAAQIQTLAPGDVLGLSWLDGGRWQFTATATEPVTALRIDTDALLRRAAADPVLGYALARGLFTAVTHRLQATRARLLDLFANPRDR